MSTEGDDLDAASERLERNERFMIWLTGFGVGLGVMGLLVTVFGVSS